MKGSAEFERDLSRILRHWKDEDYDRALKEAEQMLETWPGNAQLHLVCASLVQLQENLTHELEDAKQALKEAAAFDRDSPAAAIELGHYLDGVEDNPKPPQRPSPRGLRRQDAC